MFATDRVRLRPPTPDDALNMFRLHGDPELQLITDDKPFVPRHVGQVWARLEKQVTEPPDGETMVSLLAETVADGTFLGAGVGHQRVWPVRPPRHLAALRGARPGLRDRGDPAAVPVWLPQPQYQRHR